MVKYGLMIDNEYCTGCHSCEIACRNEHDLPLGQWGIKVLEMGPWKLMDGKKWEYRYIPVPTSYCDFCEDRLAAGGIATCQLHCLASAIELVPLEDVPAKMAEKGKMCSVYLP